MSSQGDSGIRNYNYQPTRDASDRTRQIKEAMQYKTYNSSYTAANNVDTQPSWIKFGNQFKITYDYGKLQCTSCLSNAFGGVNSTVGGS
jgi:hypothetical protein